MPPRPQRPRPARSKGYDPTASISAAAEAKRLPFEEQVDSEAVQPKKNTNDDLKKLIESLKNKMQVNQSAPQKKVPPKPEAKASWNRSISNKWSATPAYTILTRVSNHEKVPTTLTKQSEVTIKSLPHSFLYRPGADGIKVDKLSVKSGKQITWG